MNYVTGHIPLKCAMIRGWTPAEILFLRNKIGTYHEESNKVLFIDCNKKEFYLPLDECIRIPEIGEEIAGINGDVQVINVCNVDDESFFDCKSVVVVYTMNNRMLADELKTFWRSLE